MRFVLVCESTGGAGLSLGGHSCYAPSTSMHRWTSLAFGLLFVAAVIGLVFASRRPEPSAPVASVSASASTPAPISSENPVAVDAGEEQDASPISAQSSAFQRMPDGSPVPKLPDSAPKIVHLGVVLYQYRGAQGAPQAARTEQAAREKAEAILELAKKDFDEAVKQGDPGSLANAGSIPRGVLEPAIEYTVFTMAPESVHPEPINTPKGYWVVRRIK